MTTNREILAITKKLAEKGYDDLVPVLAAIFNPELSQEAESGFHKLFDIFFDQAAAGSSVPLIGFKYDADSNKIVPVYSDIKGASLILDLNDQKIFFTNSKPLSDPVTTAIIKKLYKNKKINNWPLYTRNHKIKGNLKRLGQQIKTVQFRAPLWQPKYFGTEAPPVKWEDFKYDIIRELRDLTFYHATLEENLPSIRQKGLLPSLETETEGWSPLKWHVQNAVYFTSNEDYVQAIAETLAVRSGKNAVILSVRGNVFKDYAKVVLDEDLLRDTTGLGEFNFERYKKELPQFFSSLADRIESLGYRDRIPPNKIRVELVIEPEEE